MEIDLGTVKVGLSDAVRELLIREQTLELGYANAGLRRELEHIIGLNLSDPDARDAIEDVMGWLQRVDRALDALWDLAPERGDNDREQL